LSEEIKTFPHMCDDRLRGRKFPAASSGGHTGCAIPGGAPLLAPFPPTGNAAKRND
jgi:hypothetical protein